MNKQDILKEIEQEFGAIPLWVLSVPDAILDTFWATSKWILKNTTLSPKDKALISLGTAIHFMQVKRHKREAH
jgi:hypothetical protein